MIRLLLDFPWALSTVLDAYSESSGVLFQFNELLESRHLDPVPFIEPDEYAFMWSRIGERTVGAAVFAALMRFLHRLNRAGGGQCCATPTPTPQGLRTSWKRALRDEMSDLDNWRSPQIVVPECRRGQWEPLGPEVGIIFDKCDDNSTAGPYSRVVAILEQYDSHRFASSDLDAWDLQALDPPDPNLPQQWPCRLPRPRHLLGVPLEELGAELRNIRDWEIDGRYYFLPPRDWRAEEVSSSDWRRTNWRGHKGYRYLEPEGDHRGGICDYKNEPWAWDPMHRHWDVQREEEYWKISHEGHLIGKKKYQHH